MSISSRIHDTIESWQAEWKDLIRGWALRTIAEGVKKFLEDDEPAAIDNVRDMMAKMRANPNIPPELLAKLDRLEAGGSWFMIVMAVVMSVQAIIGLVTTLWQPGLTQMSYPEQRAAQTFRLDPMAVITAWRRDPEAYVHLFDDLKDLGWSDERIEALKFVTLFYPAPADLVRWQAREVFEPEMIARYGLDSEFGAIDKEPFYKAGMTDEQILNYWRAHWEHASWMQVVEMLHRGLLTEEEVWDWFRLVEIPPFWRQHLIDTAYTWPTRVDVRRWWDMRTIDEVELRRLYSGMGYRGVNLDNYILWTKVYTEFPSLMARWTKGWITIDDVRRELTTLGMPAERVETMIQEKIKPEKSARVEEGRELTKTDIYKGVKQGVITRAEAVDILRDLDFSEDEAIYLLAINIPPDEEDKVVAQRVLSKTDIKAGIKQEIISRGDASTMLRELRYKPADIEFLLDIYEVVAKPPPEPRIREASKADIVLGVKKGLISQEEGYGMLLDLDFTPEASDFILMVKTEESPFSPISYNEFKDLTTKYRRAIGREVKPMSEELKKAADEVVRVTGDIEALNLAIKEEKAGLIEGEVLPPEATARLEELQVSRNRAESELMRIKLDYDRLMAEWRHGLP